VQQFEFVHVIPHVAGTARFVEPVGHVKAVHVAIAVQQFALKVTAVAEVAPLLLSYVLPTSQASAFLAWHVSSFWAQQSD
jgi:hypothetical protein